MKKSITYRIAYNDVRGVFETEILSNNFMTQDVVSLVPAVANYETKWHSRKRIEFDRKVILF